MCTGLSICKHFRRFVTVDGSFLDEGQTVSSGLLASPDASTKIVVEMPVSKILVRINYAMSCISSLLS